VDKFTPFFIERFICTLFILVLEWAEMRIKLLLSIIALVLLINMASATVTDVIITPKNPVVGDVISIKAKTDQSSEPISITYDTKVPVNNKGKYSFEISSIKIPIQSCFVATAKDVKTLNAKVTLWISWTVSANADSKGKATISQCGVPALTYNVIIDGDTEKKSQVPLQFSASSTLRADGGKITIDYDTRGMPPGDYDVKIGGVANKIVLKEKKAKTVVAEVQGTSDTGITVNDNPGITTASDQAVLEEKKDNKTSEETPGIEETVKPSSTDEKSNILQTLKDSFYERILPMIKFW